MVLLLYGKGETAFEIIRLWVFENSLSLPVLSLGRGGG